MFRFLFSPAFRSRPRENIAAPTRFHCNERVRVRLQTLPAMDHSETISEIIIVHRDRNFATEIRNRLESSGYAVAKIADDLSRGEMGGDKVVLIEAELWDSERVPVARIVLLALPEYDAGSAKQLPDAIVYLPLRGRELENALALAERKTEVTN